jgi:subtilisin family serine protease
MKHIVRGFAAALVIAASPALADQGRSDLVRASLGAGRDFIANELLVQFKPGVSEDAKDRAYDRIGALREEVVAAASRRPDAKGDLERVHYPLGLAISQAIRQIEVDSAVEFAEPNWVYTHSVIANDPYFTDGSLWGMYGDGSAPVNQYGSQAAEAWARGNACNSSTTVYVGVIDEGIMFNHVDLGANVWTNSDDPVDGGDNDGNGYVDDLHGWDFANKDNTIFDGTSDDHGTHVAGTIAAAGNNDTGVAGMCWNAKLISAKFLGRQGGTTANAVKAVNYITDLKVRDRLNIVATNNSWGGGGFSQSLKDAIDAAGAQNILFVAAAGNSGANIDSTPSYPAAYDSASIISVAAIDKNGALASWSNYGATRVDIGAPGVGIVSTLPVAKKGVVVSGYGSYSGTSMATPHVTGAAALYASAHPGATAAEIKTAILTAAIPTPSLAGKTSTGGRLNASGF